jgi:glycosyltransferase involved in cell wall biosynthesis
MKLLQTPVRFHPYIGGVENHVFYLSKELVEMGHEVEVLCADEPQSKTGNIQGIEVERLPYLCKIANTNICLGLPRRILRSDFDVIHTHMPTPWTCDWSIVLSKLMGKKSVITIHNDMDKPSLLGKILTNLYLHTIFLLSLSLVDRIVIVNESWETSFPNTSHILKRYQKKISVLPNGVDSELFKPGNTPKERHAVLFVSILDRHHKFKGLHYLLEAIELATKSIPDIELIIVGEGELKDFYIREAADLDIGQCVAFLGEKTQADLVTLYNRSSVFVLPSTEIEGFGIVLLEAMACKTPVIATDIVGVAKEVIQNNCGIIVEPRNSRALANAIIDILGNAELAREMGENGRRLAEEHYSWGTIGRKIESIYKRLMI